MEKPITELINFGILNIDKPAGCTSFDVVNTVRKSLGLDRAGHLGTLDPQVTGVLPVCLGKACKIQEYFMHRDKTYVGVMKLHQQVTQKKLEEEMKKFLGVINQLPPRISRVKRQVRQRKIIEFKITNFNAEKKEVDFIAKVEAGTYIRKLIDDLGKNIGGAQMISLRRIQAGIFSDKDKQFYTIENFKEAADSYKNGNDKELRKLIIPAEVITKIIPTIELKKDCLDRLKHGSPIFKNMIPEKDYDKTIKIIDSKEPFAIMINKELIEIAKWSDHFENKEIIAKPAVVLKSE
jgi:H/ACA ribonucleoprotein complex subunit 4